MERSTESGVIAEVVEAHQFTSYSTSRDGLNTHRAGCTCDPAVEFAWYDREAQHRNHVYAAIFEAGRVSPPASTTDGERS